LKNLNTLLIGTTGSGKTTLAKRMLSCSPRAIVLDTESEYEDGAVMEDFRQAVEFMRDTRRTDFHLIFRSDSVHELFGIMDCCYQMQRLESLPPLAIFLEEASLYSTSHELDPILERLMTKGRRQCLNVVTVCQWESQQHVMIRAMSRLWVALQQYTLSGDMQKRFSVGQRSDIMTLEPLVPGVEPEYGKHYVTSPPEFDVQGAWIEAVTFNRS